MVSYCSYQIFSTHDLTAYCSLVPTVLSRCLATLHLLSSCSSCTCSLLVPHHEVYDLYIFLFSGALLSLGILLSFIFYPPVVTYYHVPQRYPVYRRPSVSCCPSSRADSSLHLSALVYSSVSLLFCGQ